MLSRPVHGKADSQKGELDDLQTQRRKRQTCVAFQIISEQAPNPRTRQSQ